MCLHVCQQNYSNDGGLISVNILGVLVVKTKNSRLDFRGYLRDNFMYSAIRRNTGCELSTAQTVTVNSQYVIMSQP